MNRSSYTSSLSSTLSRQALLICNRQQLKSATPSFPTRVLPENKLFYPALSFYSNFNTLLQLHQIHRLNSRICGSSALKERPFHSAVALEVEHVLEVNVLL